MRHWLCGTGAVASAISASLHSGTDKTSCFLNARGGRLTVRFVPRDNGSFTDVWLEGPVKYVFDGEIDI